MAYFPRTTQPIFLRSPFGGPNPRQKYRPSNPAVYPTCTTASNRQPRRQRSQISVASRLRRSGGLLHPISSRARTPKFTSNFNNVVNHVMSIANSTPNLSDEHTAFLEQLRKMNIDHVFRVGMVAARDTADRAAELVPDLNQRRAVRVKERMKLNADKCSARQRQLDQHLYKERQQEEVKKVRELCRLRRLEELRIERERAIKERARREANERVDQQRREELAQERIDRMYKVRQEVLERERLAKESAEQQSTGPVPRSPLNHHTPPPESASPTSSASSSSSYPSNSNSSSSSAPRTSAPPTPLSSSKESPRNDSLLQPEHGERFAYYEAGWEYFKKGQDTLYFGNIIPWPILHVITDAKEITSEKMNDFFFHPHRPGYIGKSKKDIIKLELLRWHPDKFNVRIMKQIYPSDWDAVTFGVNRVVCFLNEVASNL